MLCALATGAAAACGCCGGSFDCCRWRVELQLARVLYSACLPRLITEAIQLCFFFFGAFLFPCKGKTTICTAAGWAPVELLEPAPLAPVAFVCAGRQTRLAALSLCLRPLRCSVNCVSPVNSSAQMSQYRLSARAACRRTAATCLRPCRCSRINSCDVTLMLHASQCSGRSASVASTAASVLRRLPRDAPAATSARLDSSCPCTSSSSSSASSLMSSLSPSSASRAAMRLVSAGVELDLVSAKTMGKMMVC